ncbi:LytR C-terminal domain-containing protein [Candidatus Poriferisocius sp.]|uniref:LytR C-terminal domain-containing protein n=1 Tax=Candidatus Poriferisocius sp. TaxID=3101276 RepID=UPI003B029B31
MESNPVPSNQMAIRGVVLVLALIAAGAFVLARGLNDDPAPVTAQNGNEPVGEAEPTSQPDSEPVDSPPDSDDPASTPVGATEEPQPPTTDPTEEPQPPASDPTEELQCRDPATIQVLVANGTDVTGAAGRLSSELGIANYVVLAPVNASPQTSSAFYYRAGYRVDAQCVAEKLGASSGPFFPMTDPPPGGITLDTLGQAYVLVMIGPDSLARSPG